MKQVNVLVTLLLLGTQLIVASTVIAQGVNQSTGTVYADNETSGSDEKETEKADSEDCN